MVRRTATSRLLCQRVRELNTAIFCGTCCMLNLSHLTFEDSLPHSLPYCVPSNPHGIHDSVGLRMVSSTISLSVNWVQMGSVFAVMSIIWCSIKSKLFFQGRNFEHLGTANHFSAFHPEPSQGEKVSTFQICCQTPHGRLGKHKQQTTGGSPQESSVD